MTALVDVVDWLALPNDVRETTETIGPLLIEGYAQTEIAQMIGRSSQDVTTAIAELREAMLSSAGDLEERLRDRAEELRRRGGPYARDPENDRAARNDRVPGNN
jgi:hypothetical protein